MRATLKAARSKWGASVVPSRDRAMRRKSAALAMLSSPLRKQKSRAQGPAELSLFDNTLVLGTLESGSQRSSLDVVDVQRFVTAFVLLRRTLTTDFHPVTRI